MLTKNIKFKNFHNSKNKKNIKKIFLNIKKKFFNRSELFFLVYQVNISSLLQIKKLII